MLRPPSRALLLALVALGGCFQDAPPDFATSTSSSTSSTSTTSSTSSTTSGEATSTAATTSSSSGPSTSSTGDPGSTSAQGSTTTAAPDMGAPAFACPRADALEACYLFEEPDKLVDGSLNGWDGTMTGVTAVPGYRGMAVGTKADSAISVADLSGPPGGPEWTVMAWVKLDSYSPQRAGVLNRVLDYGLFIETTHVASCGGGGAYIMGAKMVPIGVWTHLACVRTGGKTTVYINGKADQTGTPVVPMPPAQEVLVIANDSPPSPGAAILGAVDEILMWNAPLVVQEICEYAGLTCAPGP